MGLRQIFKKHAGKVLFAASLGMTALAGVQRHNVSDEAETLAATAAKNLKAASTAEVAAYDAVETAKSNAQTTFWLGAMPLALLAAGAMSKKGDNKDITFEEIERKSKNNTPKSNGPKTK